MNKNNQHNHTQVFLDSFESGLKIQDARVIDSGCGDGFASNEFMKRGAKVVYIHDIKDTFNKEYTDPKIVKVAGNLDWMNHCTISWSHHVLEHVRNPVEYLYRLRCKLTPCGELWLGCPNTEHDAVFAEGHVNNFTIGNLVLCLRDAGYAVGEMSWLITAGQIRVRVPNRGIGELPPPIALKFKTNKHFSIHELPREWRWNEK